MQNVLSVITYNILFGSPISFKSTYPGLILYSYSRIAIKREQIKGINEYYYHDWWLLKSSCLDYYFLKMFIKICSVQAE